MHEHPPSPAAPNAPIEVDSPAPMAPQTAPAPARTTPLLIGGGVLLLSHA